MIASFTLASLLGAAPSPGSTASPVVVTAQTCPELDAGEVQRLVHLELEAVTQEVREGPPLRVELGCTDDRLRIAVNDPVTDKHLQREVPAPANEPGQERVVALAIAQLFAASWLELLLVETTEEPEPKVPTTPGTPKRAVDAARNVAEERTVTQQRSIELALGAGVRGRALEADPFAALHVDLELRGWLTPSVGLLGRVGFDYGQAARDRGRVQGHAVMAGGGVGWRWRIQEVIGFGGSAILSAGWARLQGSSDDPAVTTAANQGATGALTVGVGPRVFSGRFRLALDAELGGMLRAPEGLVTRERAVSLGGLYVGAALRLGFRL